MPKTNAKQINGWNDPKFSKLRSARAKKIAAKRWGERWLNPSGWFQLKLVPQKGCLIWTGLVNPVNGYGHLKFKSVTHLAHRFAWTLEHGPVPAGMMVCHTCDNKPCCNPSHLFLGTHQDNMDDGKAKKRFKSMVGELHGNAVLTEKDVSKIKKQKSFGLTQTQIALNFGVHQSQISRIIHGKRWPHLHATAP